MILLRDGRHILTFDIGSDIVPKTFRQYIA